MRRTGLVALCLIAIVAARPIRGQDTESLGEVARRIRASKQPGSKAALSLEQESSPTVSLPGKEWAVALDAPDFAVQQDGTKADGRQYLLASNKHTGMVVSLTLERSPKADAKNCADDLRRRVQDLHTNFTLTDVRYSTSGSMAVVEYLIPQARGLPVRQKNLVACTAKDDVYIDIHLSKAEFKAEDVTLFQSLLDAVHIVNTTAGLPTAAASELNSRQYFERGSRYFLQERYRDAIEPYWNALEIEKRNPKLEHNLWRVLVDNLGVAYGISGDLTNAEATFRYGLSQDPKYPMFSYNMACVYGEKNDLESTLLYLNKAYEHRANNIPGESLPDPHNDNSFKRFRKNPRFLAVADLLAPGK